MGSFVVVAETPLLDQVTGVTQVREQVLIETFIV